jgi:hypothetical protein
MVAIGLQKPYGKTNLVIVLMMFINWADVVIIEISGIHFQDQNTEQ